MTEAGPTSVLICPDCGTRNPAGTDFCTNCGAYLAWDRTTAIAVVRAAPVIDPAPAEDRVPVVEPAPAVADPPLDELAVTPKPRQSTRPIPIVEPPQTVPGVAPTSESASPVEAIQPQHVTPQLVQPAATTPRPAPTLPPVMAEVAQPGDILCPNCKLPNSPSRHFCERCGADLGSAAAHAGGRGQFVAGTRPKIRRRRFPVALVVIIAIVLVAGAVAYVERAPLRVIASNVLDHVAPQKPENPIQNGWSASSSAVGHPPSLAFDGYVNTDWEPSGPGTGVGQYLAASFGKPFRLVYLQIRPGAAQTQHSFLAQGRPSSVLVTMTLSTGAIVTATISLADEPTDQQFLIGQSDVTKVQLTVLASQGTTATAPLAITEVEFRTR